MGLFNLFKKESSIPKIKDLVWKNQAGKYNACLKYVQQYPDALWICWFTETLNSFKNFIEKYGEISFDLKLARNVNSIMLAGKTIIFLEHYPLRSVEEKLLDACNAKEIMVLSSLDEPLFEQFGGNNIVGLMEKLGMKDDENIEHQMISQSIKNAQAKLQQKIPFENSANSPSEWFKINIG